MYFEVFMTNEFGDMRRLTFAEKGSQLGLRKPGEEYRFDFGGEGRARQKPGEFSTKQQSGRPTPPPRNFHQAFS